MAGLDQIMVDIETLGLEDKGRAYIVSIGACAFTFDSGGFVDTDGALHLGLDAQANEALGRRPEAKTVEWWLRQSEDAQSALLDVPRFGSATELCRMVKDWVYASTGAGRRTCVWAKSPSFDLEILKALFDQAGEVWPWLYFQERDVRTFLEVAKRHGVPGLAEIEPEIPHRADHDAIAQARQVVLVDQWIPHATREGGQS